MGKMGLPVSIEDVNEIFRLARIGIWAEEYGIDVLNVAAAQARWIEVEMVFRKTELAEIAKKALAALPEGEP